MLILAYVLGGAVLYVGLMNWLGGEEHLWGNRIRRALQGLKKGH